MNDGDTALGTIECEDSTGFILFSSKFDQKIHFLFHKLYPPTAVHGMMKKTNIRINEQPVESSHFIVTSTVFVICLVHEVSMVTKWIPDKLHFNCK